MITLVNLTQLLHFIISTFISAFHGDITSISICISLTGLFAICFMYLLSFYYFITFRWKTAALYFTAASLIFYFLFKSKENNTQGVKN